MNLMEKREQVTTVSKGKGEIRREVRKVSGRLQKHQPWGAWKKGVDHLMDGGWQFMKVYFDHHIPVPNYP